MTKTEVNYRLPDSCCMNCKHSYQSSYGDCQCSKLEPGNIIDFGGYCSEYDLAVGIISDKYSDISNERDNNYKRQQVLEVRQPIIKHCSDCCYCFNDNSHGTMCICRGKSIHADDKACKRLEEKDATENVNTIVNDDSDSKSNIVHIGFDEHFLSATNLEKYEKGICADCIHSFYTDLSIPMCRIHNLVIDYNSSCSQFVKEEANNDKG